MPHAKFIHTCAHTHIHIHPGPVTSQLMLSTDPVSVHSHKYETKEVRCLGEKETSIPTLCLFSQLPHLRLLTRLSAIQRGSRRSFIIESPRDWWKSPEEEQWGSHLCHPQGQLSVPEVSEASKPLHIAHCGRGCVHLPLPTGPSLQIVSSRKCTQSFLSLPCLESYAWIQSQTRPGLSTC